MFPFSGCRTQQSRKHQGEFCSHFLGDWVQWDSAVGEAAHRWIDAGRASKCRGWRPSSPRGSWAKKTVQVSAHVCSVELSSWIEIERRVYVETESVLLGCDFKYLTINGLWHDPIKTRYLMVLVSFSEVL